MAEDHEEPLRPECPYCDDVSRDCDYICVMVANLYFNHRRLRINPGVVVLPLR